MASLSLPSTEMEPFKISVLDDELDNLRQKLALTSLPDELDDAGWAYGVPLAEIQRLLARWKGEYDWRKHEKELNDSLPQFTKDIEVGGFGTLKIHFVHKKSDVEAAIPLLFVHGWPGGFFEVKKILPLLTQAAPDAPSFHVVALSLPGYGFSDAPRKKGFAGPEYAEVCNKLMLSLGYEEYVTQGGDWGFLITHRIASIYGKEHSKAWHTNWQEAAPPTLTGNPLKYLTYAVSSYTSADKAGLERTAWFQKEGRGYFMEQATQPQTLGYSLADSPVGLLAWIYEKLINWTDAYPWNDDEVLTWITLYWFSTPGPAASVRLYYESGHDQRSFPPPAIPHGISYFPKELVVLPRSWQKSPGLVFESEHDSGGHFAAFEKPVELVGDLRKMFGKGGPAFGVVQGRTGY